MSFNAAYVFKADNKEVIIQHKGGGNFDKYLRVNPNKNEQAGPNGGKGEWARFIVELQDNGQKCKLKSKKTGKYLRIEPNANNGADNKVDVKGTGGKWTVFKVHQQGQPGLVKLESAEQAGKYLAVQKDNVIRIGNGGPWTALKFFRDQQAAPFSKPYQFAKTNIVVIQHKGGSGGNNQHTKFLRVDPNNQDEADPDGGKGKWAQFEADPSDGGKKVRLKSTATGKYLRIHNGNINVGGNGGKWTVFNVLKQGDGSVKLQSAEKQNEYIAVGPKNVIRPGNGGPFTKLLIFRKN